MIVCIGLTQTACNTGTQKSMVVDSSYTSDEQLEIARLAVYQEGDFTNVQKFVNGKAIVTFSDTMGLISLTGEITVLPEIKDLENFANGFAAGHTRKDEACIVDTSGKIVKLFNDYSSVGNFNKDGITEFNHKNGMIGLLDKNFKEIIPAKYEQIQECKDGLLIAKLGDHWGAVDMNDKTVIPFEYIYLDAVDDLGLIRASKLSGEGFIDKTGKIMVPLTYARLFPFTENLAIFEAKEPGYFGLINSTGSIIVKPLYTEIREFKNSMAMISTSVYDNDAAKSVTKYGYLDTSGKEVIPQKYTGATEFSKEGFALVSDSTYNYFIDKLGNRMPLKFDPVGKDISVFVNGFAKIVTENSEVLRMDRFGRILKTEDLLKLRNSFFRK
jgi:hypothetical protein